VGKPPLPFCYTPIGSGAISVNGTAERWFRRANQTWEANSQRPRDRPAFARSSARSYRTPVIAGATRMHAMVSTIHSFRAHPSALYEIRQFVRQLAEEAELPAQATNDLVVAVSEACANSMLHTSSREIKVSWTVQGECVELKIRDEGVFRRRVPMPEVDGRGGHGIPLMMALVDEITIREGTEGKPGTLVRLVKCQQSD
jgi:anti-sigma regulatory factor (Ser/Thr protein kinase)